MTKKQATKPHQRKLTDHFKFTASSWRRVLAELQKEHTRLRAFDRSCPDARAEDIDHAMRELKSVFMNNPPNYGDAPLS